MPQGTPLQSSPLQSSPSQNSPLLDQIAEPSDVRKLNPEELIALAQEMRERIFSAVSINGGHLASNLGVVELTLALHHVYDFGPYPTGPDRLLFDVGHQSYPHKLLTGRAPMFDRLRKKGSVSGFPSPEESPYDLFAVGHERIGIRRIERRRNAQAATADRIER
jgi:1-deoxy-D-xylulose-5-phosphate synthase